MQGVAAGTPSGPLTTGVGSASSARFGSLTLNADGSYTYTVNNANATVQALRTSTQTPDRHLHLHDDGRGGGDLDRDADGHHPRRQRRAGGGRRHGQRHRGGRRSPTAPPGVDPTGNVLTNDTDVDTVANGETKTVQGVAAGTPSGPLTTGVGSTIVGSFGSLVLNADGSYTYAVNNSNATVQALRTSTQTADRHLQLHDDGCGGGDLDHDADGHDPRRRRRANDLQPSRWCDVHLLRGQRSG